MANLATMLITAPNGFWESIISFFNNVFTNYALAIIMLTLCIKLLMLPLDFINKRASAKMTNVQEKLGPKMQEIQKRYPDKAVQNQKLGELYQKEGFNPMGSCLPMLIYLVLSTVILFSLLGGLNSMAQYKIQDQYLQVKQAYVTEYIQSKETLTEIQVNDKIASLKDEEVDGYLNTWVIEIVDSQDTAIINKAQENAEKKYNQVKESFLWIKNVWIADSPFYKAVPSFNDYCKNAKISYSKDQADIKASDEKVYNAVMGNLPSSKQVNGFFILSVVTGVTAFLSQYFVYVSQKKKKVNNFYTNNAKPTETQKAQETSSKSMMIIFPILLTVFTFSYTAVFSLYLVVGQVVSIATTPLINWLLKKLDKKKDNKSNKDKIVTIK